MHLLIGLLTEKLLLFSLLCLLEGWFAEAEWTSVHWHVGHCNWCSLAIHWAIQAKFISASAVSGFLIMASRGRGPIIVGLVKPVVAEPSHCLTCITIVYTVICVA